ncbi:MAG: hypothetical protein OEW52_11725 [Thermoleophilia bacterium]|nr:hypothetical protein [Thermoleophilia bacterium]MDH4341158.1 hypothetical protein [Thermoleophilia bacterium]MDH5281800.1 hypothetical protein [Thermoleophilia bacterium]
MRHIMLAVTIAALAIAVPFAFAGKPGSGATISITPNEAPAWGRVWGSGCGYEVGTDVYVDVQKPNALAFLGAAPDAAGCISFTFTTDDPGTYSVSARQQLSRGKKWTVMATYELPVAG